MKSSNPWLTDNQQQIINNLMIGQIGIIPTDTIYGLATQWNNLTGINRIIRIKQRTPKKSFIILVASLEQLKTLITWDESIPDFLEKLTTPTSVIYQWKRNLPFNPEQFGYQKKTIAIRLVEWPWLKKIIVATGPLIATSCNFSNQPAIIDPKKLISWIIYVDFICLNPRTHSEPSAIIDWKTKEKIR